MVYHLQYSLFCFELAQHAQARRRSKWFTTFSTLCFVLISHNMHKHEGVHNGLPPSVLSVLFRSRTTCTSTKAFIMVYHLQYSLFCFDLVQHANTQRSSSLSVYHLLYSVVRSELVQHADAQRSSSPSNTGVSKTWPAGHTQPQSSP